MRCVSYSSTLQKFLRHGAEEAEMIQPAVDEREMAREHQRSHGYKQNPAAHLDRMQIAAETPVETEEAVDAERGQQERHGESERIDRQQRYPFGNGIFRSREGQDDRQDGPDAWRPAKSEGEAHQEGTRC